MECRVVVRVGVRGVGEVKVMRGRFDWSEEVL